MENLAKVLIKFSVLKLIAQAQERKKMGTRDFRKMKAWQVSYKLSIETYKATKNFPDKESYGLISQMRRAAVSVSANISEGSGRASEKDFVRFLYIANGSLTELECFLMISNELNYLDIDLYQKLQTIREECGKILNGLIKKISQG